MSKYRASLPQMNGDLFLTDGGTETTLIFHDGFDLPEFAAFTLLDNEAGSQGLRRYFRTYAELAKRHGVGLVLESATWRASATWSSPGGCGPSFSTATVPMRRSSVTVHSFPAPQRGVAVLLTMATPALSVMVPSQAAPDSQA